MSRKAPKSNNKIKDSLEMGNFKYQTLERLGFATEYGDHITSKIVQRLKSRKKLRWLSEQTIEDEIKQFYSDKNMPIYWGVPKRIHRITSQKMSAFILKQCAKEHGLDITNVTSENHRQFIVHNYMNPWILFEKHTSKTLKPVDEKTIWLAEQHKAWTEEKCMDDRLIPNMIEQFENTFSDWIEKGKIYAKSQHNAPVKSVLYEVKTN